MNTLSTVFAPPLVKKLRAAPVAHDARHDARPLLRGECLLQKRMVEPLSQRTLRPRGVAQPVVVGAVRDVALGEQQAHPAAEIDHAPAQPRAEFNRSAHREPLERLALLDVGRRVGVIPQLAEHRLRRCHVVLVRAVVVAALGLAIQRLHVLTVHLIHSRLLHGISIPFRLQRNQARRLPHF